MTLIIRQHRIKDNRIIGDLRLSDTAALNSLSLAMVRQMHDTLMTWANRPEIAAILLHGDGPHFCAGGNICHLYQAIQQEDWAHVSSFFYEEYRLDHLIHCYPKPIIGLATGATMGGGMGIFQGCGVRAVTGSLRMAMPEINIGIFPDVGAAWFLRRCPPPLGLFLGLSGAIIDAADAQYAGLTDYTLPADSAEPLLTALQNADWCDDSDQNLAIAHALVDHLQTPAGESNLATATAEINACCHLSSPSAIYTALLQTTQPWLQKTAEKMRLASPIAMNYWHHHWHTQATLEEVLSTDYAAILTFCRHGDFAEGVRAVLVDKNYQPCWRTNHDLLPPMPSWVYDLLPDDQKMAAQLQQELLAQNSSLRG